MVRVYSTCSREKIIDNVSMKTVPLYQEDEVLGYFEWVIFFVVERTTPNQPKLSCNDKPNCCFFLCQRKHFEGIIKYNRQEATRRQN